MKTYILPATNGLVKRSSVIKQRFAFPKVYFLIGLLLPKIMVDISEKVWYVRVTRRIRYEADKGKRYSSGETR